MQEILLKMNQKLDSETLSKQLTTDTENQHKKVIENAKFLKIHIEIEFGFQINRYCSS